MNPHVLTPAQVDHAVLLMARAGGQDGFLFAGLTDATMIRATAHSLARRGLARVAGDRIFLTTKGLEHSMESA
ncbi:MAG: hypothetical protein AB7P35_17840 [Hyphomonadaceae bacterium]